MFSFLKSWDFIPLKIANDCVIRFNFIKQFKNKQVKII
jgi:hypothetical protein